MDGSTGFLPPLAPGIRQRACDAVLTAAQTVLGTHLHGAILKGSALKGDFIPGYSDIDIHLFCASAVMRGPAVLRREPAFALQEHLGHLLAADFQAGSFQLYCLDSTTYPADWLPSPPGTFQLLAGAVPAYFNHRPTRAEHLRHARAHLENSARFVRGLPARMFDEPDSALPRHVRRVGIDLKAMPYLVAATREADPAVVWSWPLAAALAASEPLVWPAGEPRRFLAGVRVWPPDTHGCRALLRLAVDAAEALDGWLAATTRA